MVSETSLSSTFNDSLVITLDGSSGFLYYIPTNFKMSSGVAKLTNDKITKYNALFIATSMSYLKDIYHFGYTITYDRLKFKKILLPITNNKEVDWEYMDQFMKNIEFDIFNSINQHEKWSF